jgi:hypothetical protein
MGRASPDKSLSRLSRNLSALVNLVSARTLGYRDQSSFPRSRSRYRSSRYPAKKLQMSEPKSIVFVLEKTRNGQDDRLEAYPTMFTGASSGIPRQFRRLTLLPILLSKIEF